MGTMLPSAFSLRPSLDQGPRLDSSASLDRVHETRVTGKLRISTSSKLLGKLRDAFSQASHSSSGLRHSEAETLKATAAERGSPSRTRVSQDSMDRLTFRHNSSSRLLHILGSRLRDRSSLDHPQQPSEAGPDQPSPSQPASQPPSSSTQQLPADELRYLKTHAALRHQSSNLSAAPNRSLSAPNVGPTTSDRSLARSRKTSWKQRIKKSLGLQRTSAKLGPNEGGGSRVLRSPHAGAADDRSSSRSTLRNSINANSTMRSMDNSMSTARASNARSDRTQHSGQLTSGSCQNRMSSESDWDMMGDTNATMMMTADPPGNSRGTLEAVLEEKLLDVGQLSGSFAEAHRSETSYVPAHTLSEGVLTLTLSKSLPGRSEGANAGTSGGTTATDHGLVERMQSIANHINALTDEELMDPVRSTQLPVSLGSFSYPSGGDAGSHSNRQLRSGQDDVTDSEWGRHMGMNTSLVLVGSQSGRGVSSAGGKDLGSAGPLIAVAAAAGGTERFNVRTALKRYQQQHEQREAPAGPRQQRWQEQVMALPEGVESAPLWRLGKEESSHLRLGGGDGSEAGVSRKESQASERTERRWGTAQVAAAAGGGSGGGQGSPRPAQPGPGAAAWPRPQAGASPARAGAATVQRPAAHSGLLPQVGASGELMQLDVGMSAASWDAGEEGAMFAELPASRAAQGGGSGPPPAGGGLSGGLAMHRQGSTSSARSEGPGVAGGWRAGPAAPAPQHHLDPQPQLQQPGRRPEPPRRSSFASSGSASAGAMVVPSHLQQQQPWGLRLSGEQGHPVSKQVRVTLPSPSQELPPRASLPHLHSQHGPDSDHPLLASPWGAASSPGLSARGPQAYPRAQDPQAELRALHARHLLPAEALGRGLGGGGGGGGPAPAPTLRARLELVLLVLSGVVLLSNVFCTGLLLLLKQLFLEFYAHSK